jgi:tetratricopeptide (TPR) repeat protein
VKAGLAGALLLTLAGGLTGILYQWRRAEANANLARTNEGRALAQEEQALRHLGEVEAARQRAEDQARQTRQMLVKCFQVSRAPSLSGPASQPVRLELLVEIEARYRQLIRERGDDRTLRADLAEVTTSLGCLHWDNWHPDQARVAFEKALQVWQGLVREDGRNREYRAGLARAYECLGWVQRPECCPLRPGWDTRSARCIPRQMQAYEEAHRLWQGLAREQPTPAVLLSLATCALDLGRLTALVAPDQALRHLEDARGILTALLAADPANQTAREALAATYVTLGNLHHPHAPGEGLRYWKLAYGENKRLLREAPGAIRVRYDLANCCRLLSGGRSDDPFLVEAVALYEPVCRRLEEQFRVDPDNTNLDELLDSWNALAVCYQQTRQHARALQAFRRGAELGQEIAARHPGVIDLGLSWVTGLCGVALLQLEAGRPAEARATARQAVAVFARYAANPASQAYPCRHLWGQFQAIASSLRRFGASAEALALAEQVKGVFEELYREAPDQGLYGYLVSESWAQVAKSRWRLGQHEQTLAALRQALEVQRKVCDQFTGGGRVPPGARRPLVPARAFLRGTGAPGRGGRVLPGAGQTLSERRGETHPGGPRAGQSGGRRGRRAGRALRAGAGRAAALPRRGRPGGAAGRGGPRGRDRRGGGQGRGG